ncbi:nucleotidyltransferase domain-containing protein [Psychrobacter vallis]|uniref:nucleotidyltransferase domain-containing protein n=1 Tax=Psychrobacter vallis TaxID=248451 RepID=UPI00191A0B03|nr:nucleotidyltransferase domain-containing protein [Psychrobacter vallis]
MQNNDTDHIIHAIQQVCQTRQITCLHAIESGSRAWGFASPDSDYDVRLLYCHQPDWYLSLFDGKDTFEFIQNDLLAVPFDIGGWDIKKALQLLYKSNAVIFEWLHSPIVYEQQTDLMTHLQALSIDYFQPITVFHHYRGMAKNASSNLDINTPIRLKKFFYLLRALLAAKWILTIHTPPPVIMMQMLELVDQKVHTEILTLIDIKHTQDESYIHQLSPIMISAISALWSSIDNPTFADTKVSTITPLNAFYRTVLRSV